MCIRVVNNLFKSHFLEFGAALIYEFRYFIFEFTLDWSLVIHLFFGILKKIIIVAIDFVVCSFKKLRDPLTDQTFRASPINFLPEEISDQLDVVFSIFNQFIFMVKVL